MSGGHDGLHAETQPVRRVQVPLDDAKRQSGFFPQAGDQAEQVDAQTLLAQHHALQLRRRHTAAPAAGAGAGQVGVLGDFHRNLGQLDDLPSVVRGAPGQLGPAVGALLQQRSTRWAGVMRVRAKPWGRRSRGFLERSGFPSALGFRPGIRPEPLDLARPSSWAIRFSG